MTGIIAKIHGHESGGVHGEGRAGLAGAVKPFICMQNGFV